MSAVTRPFRAAGMAAFAAPVTLLIALSMLWAPVSADTSGDSTPTLTATNTAAAMVPPTPTPRPTRRPTARPSSTPRPTRTVPPTPVPVQPTPEHPARKKGSSHKHVKPTAVPRPSPTARKRHRHKQSHKKVTATPTPSATPALNLHAEDSVAPVTCNGPGRPNATKPFLLPPYHGWTSIVSYFDHDLPDYVQDGVITIATGQSASLDAVHHALDFPAYWSPAFREYLYYDGHNGYDYNLWYQPVYAAAAGKVIFARLEYTYAVNHGYGNMIMIQHRGGYVTLYGHLSKFLVHKGERVKAGQKIAISGNTGHSSGPHLHFTVFHNCTPTDPYGWEGYGPDPLQTYQGESSTMLWSEAPGVYNPAPGLPGQLPPSDTTRILLLRLPSPRIGTGSFSGVLAATAHRAASALRKRGLSVKVDLLRGALAVTGMAVPSTLYSVPGVVSITSPDLEEGARADVLADLARASLATRHRRVTIARSSKWTGYIVRLQGRAILVGKGEPGKQVDLELLSRKHSVKIHRVETDPKSGAYAVDLGILPPGDVSQLLNQLSGRGSGGASVKVHQVTVPTPTATPAPERAAATASTPWAPLLALIVIVLALAAWAGETIRRRRRG